MPSRDIMPYVSPLGGTYETRHGSMTAAQAFAAGEPVAVVDAGTLTEPDQDNTEIIITDIDSAGFGGIACYGPGEIDIDPKTGAAFATGAQIPYWPWGQGILFITSNFWATGGSATAVTPLQTDVGEAYQMTYATAGAPVLGWGLEQTAGVRGTDLVCLVHDVLDANFAPIRISSGTGVYLLFEIEAPSTAAP